MYVHTISPTHSITSSCFSSFRSWVLEKVTLTNLFMLITWPNHLSVIDLSYYYRSWNKMIVHPIILRMARPVRQLLVYICLIFFQGILSSYRQTVYHDHFYVDIFLISFFFLNLTCINFVACRRCLRPEYFIYIKFDIFVKEKDIVLFSKE